MPIKKSYTELTVPLAKMSFTPDVPSGALGANEYNLGENVEADVRGIRSVLGEKNILDSVPGTPTFVSGGFRQSGEFWFIIANDDGEWWATNGVTPWTDITPISAAYVTTAYGRTYDQSMNITEAWNGTVPIFNDTINPPFFWPDIEGAPTTPLVMYSNEYPRTISSIAIATPLPNQCTITVTPAYASTPFTAGEQVRISGAGRFWDSTKNGLFTVVSSTTTDIVIEFTPAGAWPETGQLAAAYTWNYNSQLKGYAAGFMRIYSTPNVGNILVAGDLWTTDLNDDIDHYPVTVQWSQAFAQNTAPATWQPTVLNVANQVEVPLRGTVLDAFPSGGNLYLSSYWDTVVLTPMNYATTNSPILGVRLFNQGRGLLNANCWANTDNNVYGLDARDIWVFNGSTFTGIGNQRVKHWFFDQLDPEYWSRVYMECNTEKNQIEIYYPDRSASEGVPNKMLSYRYDLDCWNAPRDVLKATFACESPVWTNVKTFDNIAPTTVTGSGTGLIIDITRTGTVYSVASINIDGSNYLAGDQLLVLGTALGGATPTNDCTLTVTSVINGNVTGLSAAGTADYEWEFNPASRCIVYAKGSENTPLIQKDDGYYFIKLDGDTRPIVSSFRRDNIKLVKDYSSKTLVHRILPEIVNLNDNNVEIDPTVNPELIGNVGVTLEGANSVGQEPQQVTGEAIATNTDYPWVQINQNAHRVNTLELYSDELVTPGTIWMCNAVTFQFTETEDDR